VGSPLFGARVDHAQLFFWPISAVVGRPASVLRLGGAVVGACPSRAAVRLLGPFPPLPATCFWAVSASVSCVLSLFLDHSLLVLGSIFMGIFVG